MDVREGLRLSTLEPSTTIISPNPISYTTSTLVSPNSRGMVQSPRLPFASSPPSIAKPNDPSNSPYVGDGSSNINTSAFSVGEQMKKKRGRPRKYGPDGGMALALNPVSSSASYSTPISDQSCKRNRGRPPGSGKKLQMEALGAAGTGFTPHVITVKAGEDVASKIMAFSQQGTRAICILSANGAICNVTLRQPATSGGTVTYEGRFEIISLSGSFLLTENGSTRSRTGGLSVALAGSDGRVMGGGVAGMLTAATPVQVIMGSFITEGKKPKQQAQEDPLSAPPQMEGFGASTLSSPISQRTSSESEEPKSPTGTNEACTTTTQHVSSIPSYMHMAWPGSNTTNHVRHDLGMTSL